MFRPLALTALLLAALLGGCVEETSEEGLRDIFGKSNVIREDNMTVVTSEALEGRILAGDSSNATWANSTTLNVVVPTLALPKTDPGPQGGGGIETPLDLGAANATIEVRLREGARLANYQARWAVLMAEDEMPNWSAPQAASATYVYPVAMPGSHSFVAQLSKGTEVAGFVAMPYIALVGAEWTIESAVRPVSPAGPQPSNYDQMADHFFLDIGPGANLEADTAFRGSYTPDKGTDIGLALLGPDTKLCSDSGGGQLPAGGVPNYAPSPEHAKEEVKGEEAEGGAWTARVGSLPNNCVDGQTYSYANAGMVPYTLKLTVSYPV